MRKKRRTGAKVHTRPLTAKMQEFARLVGEEGLDPREACARLGYGPREHYRLMRDHRIAGAISAAAVTKAKGSGWNWFFEQCARGIARPLKPTQVACLRLSLRALRELEKHPEPLRLLDRAQRAKSETPTPCEATTPGHPVPHLNSEAGGGRLAGSRPAHRLLQCE